MHQKSTIEFIGVPGVGKTTTAKLVIEQLNSLGYKCPSSKTTDEWALRTGLHPHSSKFFNTLQRLIYYSKWSYLIALFQFPWVTFNAYKFALSVSPQNQESLCTARGIANWKELLNKYVKRTACDFVVLADGGIQRISSISLSGEKYSCQLQKDLIHSFLFEEDYVVILFRTDIKTVLNRLNDRSQTVSAQGLQTWIYEDEPEVFQTQKINQNIHCLDVIFDQLKSIMPNSCLEVSSLNSAEYNAEQIISFIEQRHGVGHNPAWVSRSC